jgi:OHCU decarboxylase
VAGGPTTAPLTLADVNALDEAAFVAAFGSLFEHSPWVAEGAWRRRPFASVADLHGAFEAALREAPRERQLAVIRAHPELAGREAEEGELTAESAREQASAGLDRLSADQVRALHELNAAYRERFGFPLVVCVREHTFASIVAFGEARLGHDEDEEVAIALGEVAKIAHLRLEDVVASGGRP